MKKGRAAFARRLDEIAAGAECERLAPALSALADGELGGDELVALRRHLGTCLCCRARLREYRAAPARVAALLLPIALAGVPGGGRLQSLLESLAGIVQDRAAAFGERFHGAAELATGQKIVAVTASAAALAGGGAVTVERVTDDRPAQSPAAKTTPERTAIEPVADVTPAPQTPPTASATPTPPAPTSPPPAPPPPPAPAQEFTPEAAPPAPAPAPDPVGPLAPGGGPPAASSGGDGEFGP